jgi:hypothetical protein
MFECPSSSDTISIGTSLYNNTVDANVLWQCDELIVSQYQLCPRSLLVRIKLWLLMMGTRDCYQLSTFQ